MATAPTKNLSLLWAADYGATVNSASAVSPDTIPVSQSRGDVVHWATSPAGHRLKIVFRAKDFPAEAKGEPPFPGPNNVDLILYSSGGTIYSGPANPKLKILFNDPNGNPPGNRNLLLNYTYEQFYDGALADGRIIIMK